MLGRKQTLSQLLALKAASPIHEALWQGVATSILSDSVMEQSGAWHTAALR